MFYEEQGVDGPSARPAGRAICTPQPLNQTLNLKPLTPLPPGEEAQAQPLDLKLENPTLAPHSTLIPQPETLNFKL